MRVWGLVFALVIGAAANAAAQQRDLPPAPPTPTPYSGPAPGPIADLDQSAMLPEELVGSWSTRTDCRIRLEFRADGSFSHGSSAGTWTLADDTLTQSYGERRYRNHINQLNTDAFVLSATADADVGVIHIRCATQSVQ